MDTPKPSNTTAESAAKQIDAGVAAARTAAASASAEGLRQLSLVHQARVSRLSRTAATAAAQYGPVSSQAVAAQQAVTAAKGVAARIALVHQQAATPPPQVAARGWALQGRVYTAQLQPVSGYTVFLVDSQKIYQEAYGFAYTDSTGYFLVNFPGNTPAPSGKTAPASGEKAAASKAGKALREKTEQSTVQLFIEIADTSARPVYLSTTAFQPVVGAASYQNITLPAAEAALGDPPEEIRKVALPPPK